MIFVMIELGLDTFGDVSVDADGTRTPYPQVIRDVIAQGIRADEVGVDFFGVGEHHRDDFAVTAPEVVLAAIGARTQRIKLGAAVTVLSSDDPIRVYERFATLDAIAPSRAEIHVGRGSFTESFPLFGFAMSDYERLFEEKLELLAALRSEKSIDWEGTIRPPLRNTEVFPKTAAGSLPVWVGVGGTPESVVRAARHGMSMVLAIIGGPPERFAPFAQLYREALRELGQPALPLAVHSPGFVADTDAEAADTLWPHYQTMVTRIGKERGWPPPTRDRFQAEITQGSMYVGSSETVAKKIASTVRALGVQRFDLKYKSGTVPHAEAMRCIELYGNEVAPRVRALLGE